MKFSYTRVVHCCAAAAASLACISLSACQSKQETVLTGFIPGFVPLRHSEDGAQSWVTAKGLSQFRQFLVSPVALAAGVGDDEPAEEIAQLQATLSNDITAAFGATRTAASAAGPGVLVISASISCLKANNPLLNIAPQTQMRGRGYGHTCIEVTFTDGATGQVVGAYADADTTERFSTEKASKWGSSESAFAHWAQALSGLAK